MNRGAANNLLDLVGRGLGSPESPALVSPEGEALSRVDLERRVRDWVERFADLGLGRGDRIALVTPDGLDTAVASLGLSVAATCVPLNPALRRREFEAYFRRIRPRGVVLAAHGETAAQEAAESLGIPVWTMSDLAGAPVLEGTPIGPRRDPEAILDTDVALLLPTSGTAAEPKWVPLTHRNLVTSAGAIREVLGLTPADRCLDIMPLFHIHGLSLLYASLASGGAVICPRGLDPDAAPQWLRDLGPTWFSAAPALHRILLDSWKRSGLGRDSLRLRFVRSASAPMPVPWIAEIESTWGVPFLEAYGMTEASPQIASNRPPPAVRKPGSVGRPAGPEVVILGEDGRPLPAGVTGEVAIRGESVMREYFEDPIATRDARQGDWLRTGDAGRLDAEGDLFIEGRLAEVINRGGEKFSPREVEEVLGRHPDVAECVVFPEPHPVLGHVAGAIVVPRDPGAATGNGHAAWVQGLRAYAADRLVAFKVPQSIHVRAEVPRDAGGKVRRRQLAEWMTQQATSGGTAPDSVVGAWTPARRRMASLWEEVLPGDPPSLDSNFFLSGGHSLAVMRLVARIQDVFGVAVSPEVVFAVPTVRGLTDWVASRLADQIALGERSLGEGTLNGAGKVRIPPRRIRRGDSRPAPLSFSQQRLWFLEQVDSGPAYRMTAHLMFQGHLDVAAVGKALDRLLERHEVLRTVFPVVDGVPGIRVLPPTAGALRVVRFDPGAHSDVEGALFRWLHQSEDQVLNLTEGPVFSASLAVVSPQYAALRFVVHHIAFDAWSRSLFFDELARHYRDILSPGAEIMPPLPVSYSDFAAWQQDQFQGEVRASLLGYWRERLRGAPAVCTFPTDRPRPSVQGYRGGAVQRRVNARVVGRIRDLASRTSSTPYMVALASFQALLSFYSGQEDVVVGTPVAGRPVPEVESLIGFFANTLVIRTGWEGDAPFSEYLRRVREAVLGALNHQEMPFEKLVEDLHPDRDLGRMPFFQVMFVFHEGVAPGSFGSVSVGPAGDLQWKTIPWSNGLEVIPLPVVRHTPRFDLTLYLEESGGDWLATWVYNSDLYDVQAVERFARHYEEVLERLTEDAGRPLSQICRLPNVEEQRILKLGRGASVPTADGGTLFRRLERVAASMPDAEALVCGKDRLTFAELNAAANRLARRLRAAGVRAGDRIGVLLSRSVAAWIAPLAVSKAGAAFVGLDPDQPRERMEWMLKDAGVSTVLTDRRDLGGISGGSIPVVGIDAAHWLGLMEGSGSSEDSGNLEFTPRPEDLAYILYTSGSTGEPKGAMISHGNLENYVVAMPEVLGLTASDRYLHTASMSFSSSVRQWSVPWCTGAAVVVARAEDVQDPEALLRLARCERVTVLDLVPSYWRQLQDVLAAMAPVVRSESLPGSLRRLLSASEPLPTALWRDLQEQVPDSVQFWNLYGQTETTGIVCAALMRPATAGVSAVAPLGRPIPGLRCRILNDRGHVVPEGVTGEICVSGAGVGLGYCNVPGLTADRFTSDPFGEAGARLYRTGDLGRWRSDGTLEFLGRRDLQIKVRGVRVEPGDVEAALRGDPNVGQSAVVGVPGTDGVTRLVAYLVARSAEPIPEESDLTEQVRARLLQRLPGFMVPSQFRWLPALPRTATGKLDRGSLVRQASENSRRPLVPTPARTFRPPVTPEECCLAAIWQEVLRVERVGVDDNFFDLGGDSLLSVQVVLKARHRGLDLDLHRHFRHQTLSALTRAGLCFLSNPVAVCAELPATVDVSPAVPEIAKDPGTQSRFTVESLRAFGREALVRAGLNPEGAAIVTEVQLEASLRGQATHHLDSIPRYARRLVNGVLNGAPRIRVERDDGFSAVVDGDNGPGQWVATVAMRLAMSKAASHGIGVVTVHRSNHLGAAGHYAWEAAREGWIGLCTTNGPVILAPTGGVTPTFGNNPLAVGIPAARQRPVLLDIAMSVAPRGRIALQVAQGRPIPPGWILDREGRPSTRLEDLAAGLGVPIGGHKGYGLAMILEILSGVLSGSGFGRAHGRELLRTLSAPADFGHFFLVLDPSRFLPRAEFLDRVDRLIVETKSGQPAAGSAEIFIPGEMELRNRETNLRQGVPLTPEVYRRLVEYGREAGLQTPLETVTQRGNVS